MRALLSLSFFVLTGCFDSSDRVETRACNDTELDFTAFEYQNPGDRGPLPSNTCTEYELVETAYAYTLVRFTVDQDAFVILPIDFIGETPLQGGLWSYRITIRDYANRDLEVAAIED